MVVCRCRRSRGPARRTHTQALPPHGNRRSRRRHAAISTRCADGGRTAPTTGTGTASWHSCRRSPSNGSRAPTQPSTGHQRRVVQASDDPRQKVLASSTPGAAVQATRTSMVVRRQSPLHRGAPGWLVEHAAEHFRIWIRGPVHDLASNYAHDTVASAASLHLVYDGATTARMVRQWTPELGLGPRSRPGGCSPPRSPQAIRGRTSVRAVRPSPECRTLSKLWSRRRGTMCGRRGDGVRRTSAGAPGKAHTPS